VVQSAVDSPARAPHTMIRQKL